MIKRIFQIIFSVLFFLACKQENKQLQKDVEKNKLEYQRRIQEIETKLTQRETEIRRISNKFKQCEVEIYNANQFLTEEKNKSKETQKTFEKILGFFFESHQVLGKLLENVISSVTKSLYCLGWIY